MSDINDAGPRVSHRADTPMYQGCRPHSDPPQECSWPLCGCDPVAWRVMSVLEELGWRPPRKGPLSVSSGLRASCVHRLNNLTCGAFTDECGYCRAATVIDKLEAALQEIVQKGEGRKLDNPYAESYEAIAEAALKESRA